LRSKYLYSMGRQLYSIEHGGDLHSINPGTGAWTRVGNPADWINTRAGTTFNGKIYTLESNGTLFETDPSTGLWKQIGKKDFLRAQYLFSTSNSLYAIGFDGTLVRINPVAGTWLAIG